MTMRKTSTVRALGSKLAEAVQATTGDRVAADERGAVATLNVLRTAATPIGAGYEDISHLQKMERLTGRGGLVPTEIPLEAVKGLEEAGFLWKVGPEFVSKFRYAADVRPGRQPIVTEITDRYSATSGVAFRGDLPDWVADRGLKAVALGAQHLTIHSNEPLPVEFRRMGDPVLLAWFKDIRIHRDFGRGERFRVTWQPHQAVVVAAWDLDKELVL